MKRIEQVQRSWDRTRYMSGCQVKGPDGGVDCVRLGAGMIDDLCGFRRKLPKNLALDVALHDRAASESQLRLLLQTYPEMEVLQGNEVEPMDMVVMGPAGGGSGHLMVVGYRPNTLWEAEKPYVREIGIGLAVQDYGYELKHAYRFNDRCRWL